ncbi:hypothetical protein RJ640_008149 [Escallonia rubra]|uniref:Uncharacterized protein n=1 Tax=Escallonia rubra TaxID=112253 RepID=A0AA88ULG4_9ASTE|nr:hypothetical protein RJ640_008149 [Escallonia rubra]
MSVLQYPEALNPPSDLQIWNNAAFDNGEFEDSRSSWCQSIKPVLVSGSVDSSDASKENQSPVFMDRPVPVKPSPAPVKPLRPNGAVENCQSKPIKVNSKLGLAEKSEKKIDVEIEEIEKEISRLSSRLEVLKLEKDAKMVEKRGRVVPAKFMEAKKGEETVSLSGRVKVQRRGVSMGPSEILAGGKPRGVSLCPSEILAGVKSKKFQLGKQETITPLQQNRRKSCFWKLQNIDEEDVVKERGESLIISPKSRKAVTTVGCKKSVKKDGIFGSVQPKKLFKEGEKVGASVKKVVKPGRVIASRYNQSGVQSTPGNSVVRKRSLPENDKDEGKRCDKKRASSVGKSRASLSGVRGNQGNESRVKKRWDIPSEVVVCSKLDVNESPKSVGIMHDVLPQIRTTRCTNETPRSSGAAKRVAELVGRRSYFCSNEEVEPSVCQALDFAEEN